MIRNERLRISGGLGRGHFPVLPHCFEEGWIDFIHDWFRVSFLELHCVGSNPHRGDGWCMVVGCGARLQGPIHTLSVHSPHLMLHLINITSVCQIKLYGLLSIQGRPSEHKMLKNMSEAPPCLQDAVGHHLTQLTNFIANILGKRCSEEKML